jgi:GDP-fucose transporter C1
MGHSPRRTKMINWKQAGAVMFFVMCSLAAVLLNKALFKSFHFPCPMLTTAIQFVVAILIMVAIYGFGFVYPRYRVIESISVKPSIMMKVLPVSLTFLCMVSFNNWFLMNVGVGFYAIGKSLSVPCSVVLTFLILGVSTSFKSVLACLLITSGVFLGSYGDADISLVGLAFGGLSSIFTAGYQIAVKSGLTALQGDQWQLGFYNSLWCVCVLFPLAFIMGEGPIAAQVLFTTEGTNWTLVVALLCSGVVGFSIAQATYLSIHYTSALAHHVTGAFKSVLQAFLGFVIWRETQSLMGVSGLALTLAGSYGFLMSRLQPVAPPPLPLTKSETIV